MERINRLGIITKIILGFSLFFLFYGLVSRVIPIYFLWESLTIGWFLLFIGLISFLIEKLKGMSSHYKILIKIAIGFIIIILLINGLVLFFIPKTNAYKSALVLLNNNAEIRKEVGEISSFRTLSSGGFSFQYSDEGNSGNADFNILIKGGKKYKIVNIILTKEINTDWKIVHLE